MILTYKVKHNRDFSQELIKAKDIAKFAIYNRRSLSSKAVNSYGLKAIISNQILRKYGRNLKAKTIHNVNLIVPAQGIKTDRDRRELYIPCLQLRFNYMFPDNFEKVNQIEINTTTIFVSVTVKEQQLEIHKESIGIDLNATGHCVVAGNPNTGKVYKLGKETAHIHRKYKQIRRSLQKKKKYREIKRIKDRESRIVRNINHQISRKIVNLAVEQRANINLEKLEGIRKNKKQAKSFRYALNSWSFYQLRQMIEYKAKLAGISVNLIDPAYTSKVCSRCGYIGDRKDKLFKCSNCEHVDHADANASFNIAGASGSIQSIRQLQQDRDCCKGNTDTPERQRITKTFDLRTFDA